MTNDDYLAWLILTNDRPRPVPAPTACASCGARDLPPVALAGNPARCAACWYKIANDMAVVMGQWVNERTADD